MRLLPYIFSLSLCLDINTPASLRIENGKHAQFEISTNDTANSYFIYTEHMDQVIDIDCSNGTLATFDCQLVWNKKSQIFNITTKVIGQEYIKFNGTNGNKTWEVTRIAVIKSEGLYIFNEIIGWVYFLAWTVSFYPQIILNFQRKSVAGLNFDFVLLNIIGFTCYSAYNLALYFSDTVFELYEKKHPDGVNPVLPNDIFFSIHAVVASVVTGVQIFSYDRNGQKLSLPGGFFSIGCMLTAIFGVIAPALNAISWLDYLTILSSIKLAITIVKYMPQAYMNYKRKSTDGWSIGNVLLDLTGGSLSMLQMLLQGVNNQQFSNIFGDPTKFGLGLFSILFDCLFIVQHYVIYRGNVPYTPQLDDWNNRDEE